ncbi:uncharacterized protein Tco025E_00310 [Trypanosoma conorhini]|uniref:Uncharacterized protein n=1 Tax=Trypanosoma conorhini TaxID=83891 RepID=A0A3R7NUX2_9TRYP|nr:uncharacterized protein Tco025E_00310 [Trypanosoma conorhini]RNF27448.1 hypothetical protein Tco025E_00310 [Trypanosoma conorhini]
MQPWGEATAAELSAAAAYHQLIQQQQQSLLHRLHQASSVAPLECKQDLCGENAAGDVPGDDAASGDGARSGGEEKMAALGQWAVAAHATAADATGKEPRRITGYRGEAVRSLLLRRPLTNSRPQHTAHHRQEQAEEDVHHSGHELRRKRQSVDFLLQHLPDVCSIITASASESLQ